MKKFIFAAILLHAAAMNAAVPGGAVTLSPGATEAVITAGGAAQLRGRSSACLMPEVRHLPLAGDFGVPNVEKILRTRATMVITDTRASGSGWRLLRRAGLEVVLLRNERIADYPANLRLLGEKLRCRKIAEAAARRYESAMAELRRTKSPKPLRVLILFSASPPVTCGSGSFIHEAVEYAGGINAGADRATGYFAISPEKILRHSPQVIICAGVPENLVRQYFAKPVFRCLPAVRHNRFVSVDADRFCRNNFHLPAEIKRLKSYLSSL